MQSGSLPPVVDPGCSMKKPSVLLTVAAVAFWMAPGVAEAKIVIGQSIHGVALGQTKDHVAKVLGDITAKVKKTNDWSDGQIRVHFHKGRVDHLLYARDKGDKTSKGIGLGTKRAKLKAAYPNAKCSPGPYGEGSENCVVLGRSHGRRSYTGFLFQTATGGVVEVNTGYGTSGF